jgi:WD40 repeat protein
MALLLRKQWVLAAVLIGIGSSPISITAADGHLGPVTDVATLGGRIFSVSQGGVYEGVGTELSQIFRPPFRVMSLAVFGGKLLLGGGEPGVSGVIGVCDLDGRGFRSLPVAKDLVYDVALHSSQNLAAVACADGRILTLKFPSLGKDTLVERYHHTAAARAVAFSTKGDHLASAGLDALVMLLPLDGRTKPIPLQDHSDKIDCLTFSPDSSLIASGSRDGKVRIHNLEGRLVRTYTGITPKNLKSSWGRNTYIRSLTWGGPIGSLVAGDAAGVLYQLSTIDNRWKPLEGTSKNPVYSLQFAATGRLLVGTHLLTGRSILEF